MVICYYVHAMILLTRTPNVFSQLHPTESTSLLLVERKNIMAKSFSCSICSRDIFFCLREFTPIRATTDVVRAWLLGIAVQSMFINYTSSTTVVYTVHYLHILASLFVMCSLSMQPSPNFFRPQCFFSISASRDSGFPIQLMCSGLHTNHP